MEVDRRTLLERVTDRNDGQAWVEFAGLYRSLLLRYTIARGLSAETAVCVAEDCMAAIADRIHTPGYVPNTSAFKRWVGELVRHRVREAQQGTLQPVCMVVHPRRTPRPVPAPDDKFERVWNAEHMRHCLGQVRVEGESKTIEVFRRLVLDEWTVERVCTAYNLTPQHVSAMRARLIHKLRQLIRDVLEG